MINVNGGLVTNLDEQVILEIKICKKLIVLFMKFTCLEYLYAIRIYTIPLIFEDYDVAEDRFEYFKPLLSQEMKSCTHKLQSLFV